MYKHSHTHSLSLSLSLMHTHLNRNIFFSMFNLMDFILLRIHAIVLNKTVLNKAVVLSAFNNFNNNKKISD
jgi:hypothetical protein